MIDGSHIKVHQHGTGAKGGNQAIKIRLAVDAHGMPVRMLITEATTADCTQAAKLIEGIEAENLLADKGYDTDALIVLKTLLCS